MSCSSPGWPLDLDGNVVPPRRVPAVLVSAGGLDRWSPSRRRAKPLLTMGRGAGAGYKTRLTGLTGSLHYKSSSPFPRRDAEYIFPTSSPPERSKVQGVRYGQGARATVIEVLDAIGIEFFVSIPTAAPGRLTTVSFETLPALAADKNSNAPQLVGPERRKACARLLNLALPLIIVTEATGTEVGAD